MNKRKNKNICRKCGEKRAVYKANGKLKARSDHDLCWRCFRAELDREQALKLAEKPV